MLVLGITGCSQSTSRLTPDLERRFAEEVIVRRADVARFRYTEGGGRRGGTWDEGRASLVVTRRTILLHQGRRVLLEITADPRSRYAVRRDHDRVSIHTGSGQTAKTWSFQPDQDAAGWARDLRRVLTGTDAEPDSTEDGT